MILCYRLVTQVRLRRTLLDERTSLPYTLTQLLAAPEPYLFAIPRARHGLVSGRFVDVTTLSTLFREAEHVPTLLFRPLARQDRARATMGIRRRWKQSFTRVLNLVNSSSRPTLLTQLTLPHTTPTRPNSRLPARLTVPRHILTRPGKNLLSYALPLTPLRTKCTVRLCLTLIEVLFLLWPPNYVPAY